jgi:hypothetical protein
MKIQTNDARISILPLFSDILKENYKKMRETEEKIKKIRLRQKIEDANAVSEQEIALLERELEKASIGVVVFTAMSIESYIYDYASRHLGDTYVKEHLDKMDVISKWVVIPELITGKELPNREDWYPLLKKLVKSRNSIVHHKSSSLPASLDDINSYIQKINISSDFILETAKQSVLLLGVLADKISKIDPEETPWVHQYFT